MKLNNLINCSDVFLYSYHVLQINSSQLLWLSFSDNKFHLDVENICDILEINGGNYGYFWQKLNGRNL